MIAFRSQNFGKRPEQIIFYRDGVSEGQFQSVSCCSMGPEEMRLLCMLHGEGKHVVSVRTKCR